MTGILYGLMNSSTLDERNITHICEDQNAKLPEPRSERENEFLYRLINHTNKGVLLGLNAKDGGVWRWNSDNSRVTWFNWKRSGPRDSNKYSCVVFRRRKSPRGAWMDIKCKVLSKKKALRKLKKVLICQRGSGRYQ